MKKTIETITAVIGIVVLPLSGSIKSEDHLKVAMFRANLYRTSVYDTKGVHQLGGLKWESKTGGVGYSPAATEGVVYFESDGLLYALEGRITDRYDFEREKEQEDTIVNTEKELDSLKSMPYAYQGSLFLNNLYGERTVDIYVTVFEKDHKINQIILKVYNHQGVINFMYYAPRIRFPKYPDKPYPLSGLIICLPRELRGKLPMALKKPQYSGTWREFVFHYGPDMCTEQPKKFPSISDILSGKAKLCIKAGGHAFTIDNLKKLPQR